MFFIDLELSGLHIKHRKLFFIVAIEYNFIFDLNFIYSGKFKKNTEKKNYQYAVEEHPFLALF